MMRIDCGLLISVLLLVGGLAGFAYTVGPDLVWAIGGLAEVMVILATDRELWALLWAEAGKPFIALISMCALLLGGIGVSAWWMWRSDDKELRQREDEREAAGLWGGKK